MIYIVFISVLVMIIIFLISSSNVNINSNNNNSTIEKQLNYVTNNNISYIKNFVNSEDEKKINFPSMINYLRLLNITDIKGCELPWLVGIDEYGKTIIKDISKCPHLLIAGATGQGKSVALNTLILTLILKGNINTFEFIMIDPKIIELSLYKKLPNLNTEIITELEPTLKMLDELIIEMNKRYELLSKHEVKSLKDLEKVSKIKLKKIVVCFDEFADFSLQDKTIHTKVTLLAQKSRAAGIHLVITTQKPVQSILDTKIKANIPCVVALKTTSQRESKNILDENGAEKLNSKGEMILKDSNGMTKIKGAFISDDNIKKIVKNIQY